MICNCPCCGRYLSDHPSLKGEPIDQLQYVFCLAPESVERLLLFRQVRREPLPVDDIEAVMLRLSQLHDVLAPARLPKNEQATIEKDKRPPK